MSLLAAKARCLPNDPNSPSPQPVFPGPCPPEGCPPPTRIECIWVRKVYDECFQTHSLTECLAIPPNTQIPEGTEVASCRIRRATCREIAERQLVQDGLFRLTLLITVEFRVRLRRPNLPVLVLNGRVRFTKTVVLCAPEGTVIRCEFTGSRCDCVLMLEDCQVCCTLDLCVIVESISRDRVKLLVPSYGFCVPAPCEMGVLPFECPPVDRFPPQCEVVPPPAGTPLQASRAPGIVVTGTTLTESSEADSADDSDDAEEALGEEVQILGDDEGAPA